MNPGASLRPLSFVALFCAWWSLVGGSPLSAEPTVERKFSARLWQIDDGLPLNSVRALVQTRDGFLWLATYDGLARFDGLDFTLFTPDVDRVLPTRAFNCLYISSDGTFWIGSDGGGLLAVRDGTVRRLTKADGLADDSIRVVLESGDGALWVGTSGGLSRIQGHAITTLTVADGLADNVIRALAEDRQGVLWVGTANGLSALANGVVMANYRYQPNVEHVLPQNSIRALLVDRDGRLWVGGNGGLSLFDGDKFLTYGAAEGLLDTTVSALFQDRHGTLWVGSFGGLHRMVNQRLVPERIESGTLYDPVYGFTEDREGNLWVGTQGGLYRLSPRRFSALTKQDGLTHNATVSVLEQGGSLWIGTWGGGINELRDGQFIPHPTSPVLPFDFTLGIFVDRDQRLWIGTDFDGGLYARAPNGHIRRWGKEHGMNESALSVITQDREGRIWVGARTGLLKLENEQLTSCTTADGLPSNFIKALHEDRAGVLWVGTMGGLAYRKEERFERVRSLSNAVFAIYADEQNVLWVGTKGAGLARFKGDRWRSYSTAEGLLFEDVFEILEHDGWLWMTCSKGVFRVRKTDFDHYDAGRISGLRCIGYDKFDGMISADCKGAAKPAAWRTADGRLWFPTSKGMVIADADIPVNEVSPPVCVERVFSGRRQVWARGVITTDDSRQVVIRPGSGELEIHYTALSLTAAEKNRFRYKLDGVDRDWVEAGGRRVAYYNNLAPGSYRFRVVACNNDFTWNHAGAEIACVLQPHFWQTATFKTLAGLSVAGCVLAIYRVRVRRIREIEQLRVRIAADLHDEVGSSLWSIALLSELLHKQPSLGEEDRRDLEEINRIARQTANSVRDIVWFIKPEYDTLQDLVLRMRDVAQSLLGRTEHRFHIDVPDLSRKLPLDFRQNMLLMFKEVLTNISRHARATCVDVEVRHFGRDWLLVVRDNGVGFDPAAEASGSGLKNLSHRAGKLRGRVEVQSSRGAGTEIRITVPL